MFCPNCGDNFEGEAGFCPTCGAQIGGAQPQMMNQQMAQPQMNNMQMNGMPMYAQPKKKKTGLIIGIAVAAVVAIVAIVCVIVFGKNGTYTLTKVRVYGMEMDVKQAAAMSGEPMPDVKIKINGNKCTMTSDGETASCKIKWKGNKGTLTTPDGEKADVEYKSGKLIVEAEDGTAMIFEK